MDGKTWQQELKAEPLTSGELDLWLSGKRSRSICVVPFGGPLPGGKKGKDLDGEFFDEASDLYGEFAALRKSRERLVDWHHDNDPTGIMKGAIVGMVHLDQDPQSDGSGVWGDFWANAGEKRLALVASLERGNVPLFGSSQAVYSRKGQDGHIDVWPLYRHTITTSPQNTFAVVPPLKALLTTDYSDALSKAALEAALLELDGESPLRTLAPVPGERVGTASDVLSQDQETLLSEALAELSALLKHE